MKIRKLRLKWEQQTESIEGFDPYRWDSRYVSTADDSIWHLFDTCKDFDKTGKVRKLKRYESFGKPLCENCKSLHKLRKELTEEWPGEKKEQVYLSSGLGVLIDFWHAFPDCEGLTGEAIQTTDEFIKYMNLTFCPTCQKNIDDAVKEAQPVDQKLADGSRVNGTHR